MKLKNESLSLLYDVTEISRCALLFTGTQAWQVKAMNGKGLLYFFTLIKGGPWIDSKFSRYRYNITSGVTGKIT
jgi:hypothetical protein